MIVSYWSMLEMCNTKRQPQIKDTLTTDPSPKYESARTQFYLSSRPRPFKDCIPSIYSLRSFELELCSALELIARCVRSGWLSVLFKCCSSTSHQISTYPNITKLQLLMSMNFWPSQMLPPAANVNFGEIDSRNLLLDSVGDPWLIV